MRRCCPINSETHARAETEDIFEIVLHRGYVHLELKQSAHLELIKGKEIDFSNLVTDSNVKCSIEDYAEGYAHALAVIRKL